MQAYGDDDDDDDDDDDVDDDDVGNDYVTKHHQSPQSQNRRSDHDSGKYSGNGAVTLSRFSAYITQEDMLRHLVECLHLHAVQYKDQGYGQSQDQIQCLIGQSGYEKCKTNTCA